MLLKEEGFSGGKKEVRQYTSAIKEACKAFLLRDVSREKSQEIEKPIMVAKVMAPEREGLKLKEGRKKFTVTLADLLRKGYLRVGEVVEAQHMGCKLEATITENGRLRTFDGKEGKLSPIGLHLVNLERKKLGLNPWISVGGWVFFHVERKGRLVSLAELREEAESANSTF